VKPLSKAFAAWALGERNWRAPLDARSRDRIGQDDYAYEGEDKADDANGGDLSD
jgi:hypothetical protein